MRLAESLIDELEREAKSTARMLQRVPADRLDWKPHAKSMSVGRLAFHVATLPLVGVTGLKEKVKDVGGARPSLRADADFLATLRDSVAHDDRPDSHRRPESFGPSSRPAFGLFAVDEHSPFRRCTGLPPTKAHSID